MIRGVPGFAGDCFVPPVVNESMKVNMWEGRGVEIIRIGKGLIEPEEEERRGGGGVNEKGLLWFSAAQRSHETVRLSHFSSHEWNYDLFYDRMLRRAR